MLNWLCEKLFSMPNIEKHKLACCNKVVNLWHDPTKSTDLFVIDEYTSLEEIRCCWCYKLLLRRKYCHMTREYNV